MRRIALMLVTLGILCLVVNPVQAQGGHGGHHGHGGYPGWCGPAMVHPHGGWYAPPVIVRPPLVYPPVYRYRYYDPGPSYGFFYQGRGVSVGVGF